MPPPDLRLAPRGECPKNGVMAIHELSDTALLTAYARAIESRRSDALFVDKHALHLAGEQGAELASECQTFATIANSIACRTAVFDELVERTVRTQSVELVVNLASGLDTRPWRLTLPGEVRWIDVDLPNVLEYKRGRMAAAAPLCMYEECAADLTAQTDLDKVLAQIGRDRTALVITEGLLVYFSESDVASLANRLSANGSIRWWITDIAGPRALMMMAKAWGSLLQGAAFRFGPSDPVAFFREHGWSEVEFRSSHVEAQRLGRMSRPRLLQRILLRAMSSRVREEVRRLAGVTLLKRSL